MGPGKVLERLLQQDAAVYCGNNLNLKEQNAIVCKYILDYTRHCTILININTSISGTASHMGFKEIAPSKTESVESNAWPGI
jgi:hypothetical protein